MKPDKFKLELDFAEYEDQVYQVNTWWSRDELNAPQTGEAVFENLGVFQDLDDVRRLLQDYTVEQVANHLLVFRRIWKSELAVKLEEFKEKLELAKKLIVGCERIHRLANEAHHANPYRAQDKMDLVALTIQAERKLHEEARPIMSEKRPFLTERLIRAHFDLYEGFLRPGVLKCLPEGWKFGLDWVYRGLLILDDPSPAADLIEQLKRDVGAEGKVEFDWCSVSWRPDKNASKRLISWSVRKP